MLLNKQSDRGVFQRGIKEPNHRSLVASELSKCNFDIGSIVIEQSKEENTKIFLDCRVSSQIACF